MPRPTAVRRRTKFVAASAHELRQPGIEPLGEEQPAAAEEANEDGGEPAFHGEERQMTAPHGALRLAERYFLWFVQS